MPWFTEYINYCSAQSIALNVIWSRDVNFQIGWIRFFFLGKNVFYTKQYRTLQYGICSNDSIEYRIWMTTKSELVHMKKSVWYMHVSQEERYDQSKCREKKTRNDSFDIKSKVVGFLSCNPRMCFACAWKWIRRKLAL